MRAFGLICVRYELSIAVEMALQVRDKTLAMKWEKYRVQSEKAPVVGDGDLAAAEQALVAVVERRDARHDDGARDLVAAREARPHLVP